MRQKIFHMLVIGFLSFLCIQAYPQADKEGLAVETREQDDGKITFIIKNNSKKATSIEIRKGYPERDLIKKIDLEKTWFKNRFKIQDMENGFYTIFLKEKEGKLIDVKSMQIE